MSDASLDRILASAPDSFHHKFKVERFIASGGFATVLLARHNALRRSVAIKILHRLQGTDAARFRREANLLSKLSHPGIMPLLEFEATGDFFYIVIPYYSRGSLDDSSRKGRSVGDWIRTFSEILEALGHVHEKGMMHRDLKPANIFLGEEDHAVLGDFGLGTDATSTILTRPGESLGTPAYMSPEQFVGGILDARTDLHAVGVVMYECLTGSFPHVGATPAELYAAKIATTPLRFPAERAVPETLQKLIGRLLEPTLERRTASAGEALESLRPLLESTPPQAAAPVRSASSRRQPSLGVRVSSGNASGITPSSSSLDVPSITDSWSSVSWIVQSRGSRLTTAGAIAVLLLMLGFFRMKPGTPPLVDPRIVTSASPSAAARIAFLPADTQRLASTLERLLPRIRQRDRGRLDSARDLTALDEEAMNAREELNAVTGLEDREVLQSLMDHFYRQYEVETLDLECALWLCHLGGLNYTVPANLIGMKQLTTMGTTLILKDPAVREKFAQVPHQQGASEMFCLKKFIDTALLALDRLVEAPVAHPRFGGFCGALFEIPRTAMAFSWRDDMKKPLEQALASADARMVPESGPDPRGVRLLCRQIWRMGQIEMVGDELAQNQQELTRITETVVKSGYLQQAEADGLLQHRGALLPP